MKYKDTMESPWGVLKLTVLKSGPKLIGDFSFPATCWGPHPQRLGHGRASLRKHRHRCSWHRKFHSLTSMFFLMNHDPYHPWSGIFTYINYTWMDMDGMGDEHLKLQHPTSHLPSNRLKFCNLKIARSHSDRMGPWTSSTNTPFLTRSVWCFCFCLKNFSFLWSKCTAMISTHWFYFPFVAKGKCSHFHQPPFENTGFCRTNQREGLSTSSPIVDAKFLEIPVGSKDRPDDIDWPGWTHRSVGSPSV